MSSTQPDTRRALLHVRTMCETLKKTGDRQLQAYYKIGDVIRMSDEHQHPKLVYARDLVYEIGKDLLSVSSELKEVVDLLIDQQQQSK